MAVGPELRHFIRARTSDFPPIVCCVSQTGLYVLEVVSVEKQRSYAYVWKVYVTETKYSNVLF